MTSNACSISIRGWTAIWKIRGCTLTEHSINLVQQLVHRRVPQITALYIAATWGLVQFVDFATARYALSPHLTDLALLAPLLLLPSVLLVAFVHGAPG